MKNRLSQAIFSPIFCQAVYKAMLSSWREPPIHPPPSTSVSPTVRAPPPASSSPGTPRHRSIFSLSFVHHTVCTHCDQGLYEILLFHAGIQTLALPMIPIVNMN